MLRDGRDGRINKREIKQEIDDSRLPLSLPSLSCFHADDFSERARVCQGD